MISFEMKGDLSVDLFRRFQQWSHPDPIRLAMEIRGILIEENAEGLKRGIDADGRPMNPIMPATFKRRGGFGPPLVPKFDGSRMISGFEVAVAKEGESTYLIRAGWPNVPFAKYTNTGFTIHTRDRGDFFVLPRPTAGFRPSTNIQIDEAIDRECARYLIGEG